MTKNIYFLLIGSFFLVGLLSCERPPELPHEPKIAFGDIQFYESSNIQISDTLKITVSFEDGDGDLGLSQAYSDDPYHEYTYFNRKDPKQKITNLNTYEGDLLQLGDTPGGYDTLPPYNAFNQPGGQDCINYRILSYQEDSVTKQDTVYIQINEYNKNFVLDFLVLRDGEYQLYDFLKESCVPSDGRFQILNTSENSRPLEGDLTYNFRINRLKRHLADDTIKVRVKIRDRALHTSNTVESEPFTLDGIKMN